MLHSDLTKNYFPTTRGHITAHAEVVGGSVLCPALLRLIMSPHGGGLHQGVGVTDIEYWVINRYHS